MTKSVQIGHRTYEVIAVPRLRFKEIIKESGTRGHFYVLWPGFRQCFIGQSIPPIIAMIRELTNARIHSSSFYRVARGETRKISSKGFSLKMFWTFEDEEINDFLQQFEIFFVCSQNLDAWVIDEDSLTFSEENKNGGESP